MNILAMENGKQTHNGGEVKYFKEITAIEE